LKWSLALLVPAEPGRRNRRTIDGVLVAVGIRLAGLEAVVARSAPETDEEIGRRWPRCSVGRRGLARGHRRHARACVPDRRGRFRSKAVDAGSRPAHRPALVAAVASVLAQVVDSEWAHLEVDPLSLWGFPTSGSRASCGHRGRSPELVRPVRLLAIWLVGLASLGVVALEIALPRTFSPGLAVGLGAGAVVRLALGSPLGAPPIARVRAALSSLGVDIGDLRIGAHQQRGAADYFGHGDDGRPLKVRVPGRDAQDTQRLARRWRLVAYRDPPRSAPRRTPRTGRARGGHDADGREGGCARA
jgi:hypothetical protein